MDAHALEERCAGFTTAEAARPEGAESPEKVDRPQERSVSGPEGLTWKTDAISKAAGGEETRREGGREGGKRFRPSFHSLRLQV